MPLVIKAKLEKVVKPPVWRRFIMNEHDTFSDLHWRLQTAFHWDGFHMHAFGYQQQSRSFLAVPFVIASKDFLQEGFYHGEGFDEAEAILGSWLTRFPKGIVYNYDFGDDWRVSITLEKILMPEEVEAAELKLKTGKGAPPPEDCGGVWTFMHLRQVLADHRAGKEVPQDQLEWAASTLGEDFDPDAA